MSNQWNEFSFKEPLDGYVDWACDPGNRFPSGISGKETVHLLISLKENADLQRFKQAIEDAKLGQEEEITFTLSSLYNEKIMQNFDDRQQFPAQANRAFIAFVENNPELRAMIDRIILAPKLPVDSYFAKDSGASAEVDSESGEMPSDNICVIGIIEEGVAFANERFRQSVCKSRIEYLWLQDGPCKNNSGSQVVDYGLELTKEKIDVYLSESCHGGLVDEDEVYRKTGLVDFSRSGHKAAGWRVSHGAHIMDLACGYEMGRSPSITIGANEDVDARPIVCVQLPTSVVADTSGLGLEKFMIEGLEYIFMRADSIARALNIKEIPVVVNFSSGVRAGPHDGTHPVEKAIDRLVRKRRHRGKQVDTDTDDIVPTEVVLPTGNSHLAQIHAKITLQSKHDEATLIWRLQPDDLTSSFLEIWLPAGWEKSMSPLVQISICPPGGEASALLGDDVDREGFSWIPDGKHTICKISFEQGRSEHERGRYLIAVQPTAHLEMTDGLAPSGDWVIKFTSKSDQPIEDIQAWIHWDDSPLGYRRTGRQSYFVDKDYERFDPISGREIEEDNEVSYIRREGNISGIATGEEPVVVGAYVGKELKAAKYSSGGPVVNKGRKPVHRTGPNAMAVSEESEALRGVLAAGTRSGSSVSLNGTSVAAPQVTRMIANEFSQGKKRGCSTIEKKAADDEKKQVQHGRRHRKIQTPKQRRKGCGRLIFSESRHSQVYRKPV